MPNEYEPWKERGETELEYFKRLYLEMSAENERLEQTEEKRLGPKGAGWMPPWKVTQMVKSHQAKDRRIAELGTFEKACQDLCPACAERLSERSSSKPTEEE